MKTTHKIAATAALLAVGATAGLGLTPVAAQDEAPADPPAVEQPQRPDRADRAAALAEQLGLSVEDVTAAKDAAKAAVDAQFGEPVRPDTPPETDEERDALRAQHEERREAFQSAFATELGVSVDDLDAVRQAQAEEHLAEAVESGRLTQEEADARLDAIQNGEAPSHRGPGGPGQQGPGPDGAGQQGPGGPGGPGGPEAPADA
jgi:hypothetical protein